MAYRIDQNPTTNTKCLVIDGFEKGIAQSPYLGIANMRNVNTSWYPSVAYVNYRRQACTLSSTGEFFAGIHSTNVSGNLGWIFNIPSSAIMANPVAKAVSPAGLNYVLDSVGQVWKQNAVNSSTFSILADGAGRVGNGAGGLAYWNNYLIVFGDDLIEFCGDGTGDSTITSANWNVNSYVNQQNPVVWQPQTYQATGVIANGATSLTFASSYLWPWATSSTATIIFSDSETRTCTIINGSGTVSWTGGITASTGVQSLVWISSPGIMYNPLLPPYYGMNPVIGTPIIFSTNTTLPSPLVAGTTYYIVSAPVAYLNGYSVFSVSATPNGTAIVLTTQGTGVQSFITNTSSFPVGNVTHLNFTGDLVVGQISNTIASYILPNGTTAYNIWLLPTGTYNIIDANGNNILATFTNDSSTVNFSSPINQWSGATYYYPVQILNPNITNYTAHTSNVDGNVYFANGQSMGALIIAEANVLFNPSNFLSYTVSYALFTLATGANQGSDAIVDAVDLQSNMIVAGKQNIYTWDYTSSYTTAPVPIPDSPIVRLLNNLNQIYVFTGQKGNIYISNGSYAQLLTKIPDYIAGVIDPIWSFGGIMTHRGRVYFQVLAQNTSGTNILAGVFSIVVSPSLYGQEIAGALVMESQNSYGLIPSAGALSNGLLMDNEPSSNGQDSYYSAWSNGASTGGIDYNDTTLWQNYEPTIETDIIPIGTILEKQTLGLIEFKLDRPMVTGDSIKLYWRPSLSDSYILIGTTTTAQISEYFNSNISQAQWAQFMVTYKCAASGSSFIPLREVRLNYGQIQ